jgi:hypothetical protein
VHQPQTGLQDKDPETKVLGLRWNPNTDTLQFQQRQPPNDANNSITKREVLRESSKIYDPLGILTPVTIRAKILIQELWEEGYSWDESLQQELQEKWLALSKDLQPPHKLKFLAVTSPLHQHGHLALPFTYLSTPVLRHMEQLLISLMVPKHHWLWPNPELRRSRNLPFHSSS